MNQTELEIIKAKCEFHRAKAAEYQRMNRQARKVNIKLLDRISQLELENAVLEATK